MNTNKEKYDFNDLLDVVKELRGENGCEWDRAQTHESLLKYLIEESYEYIEATKQKNPAKQADELGDVLLQIVMSAEIGSEQGKFDISDVTDAICRKMIYRHPHVFSDTKVENVDDILKNWDVLKKKEQNMKNDKDVLKAISKDVPALMRAQKVIEKIKKYEKNKKNTAFDKESIDKFDKMLDNNVELSNGCVKSDAIGEALLNLIYIASENKIPLEMCLNEHIDKLIDRFN